MLGSLATCIAPCICLGDAADDVRERHLVGGIDLVGPRPAGGVLEIHVDHEVPRYRSEHHAVAGGIDGHRHARVGQVWGVVLVAAPAKQKDVDPLAVLQLVCDGARRRLDRLDDLAQRIEVLPGDPGHEVVEPLIGQGCAHEDEHQQGGNDQRRDRAGQAVGDVIARSPGPWPSPTHAHGDSSVQALRNGDQTQIVTRAGLWPR